MFREHSESHAAGRNLNKAVALLAFWLLLMATARAKQGHDEGRRAFESRCAGCHGLDGRGGERAPDVATQASVLRRSDAELFQIIQNGVPARGMPSFGTMDGSRIKAVVSYLRLLQGKIGGEAVSGDPQQGKALFFGKAHCSDCHMVEGAGGFIASDLSVYGRTRAPDEIHAAITAKQNESRGGADRLTTVTTRDGQKFSGVLRNEDNFSVQLQTLDGAFHLFTKADLQSVVRSSEPLMPSNYGSTLSRNEIDDLTSFLVASARGSNTAAAAAVREKRNRRNVD